jgi:hypothetical protein
MKPNRRETIAVLAGAGSAALAAAGMTSPAQAREAKPAKLAAAKGGGEIQNIETRIGRLEFTHDFANGYPTDATIDKLYDERDFQRACQAYLWSLPAVSFKSWQRGITQQLGARNGQVVSILSMEARRGILTANATTPYYLGFADLSAGPRAGSATAGNKPFRVRNPREHTSCWRRGRRCPTMSPATRCAIPAPSTFFSARG